MTDRRQLHIPVLVGVSATMYAATLAAVTGLQSGADRTVIADQAPAAATLDLVSARSDALAVTLDRLRAAMDRDGVAYDAAADDLLDLDARLAALAADVAAVNGRISVLPTPGNLPAVPQPAPARRRPSVHATTGASGG